MRKLIALLFFLSTVGQTAAMVNETVDLSDPRVLESLRAHRPDHYAKVQAILALAEVRADDVRIGPWIEARFDASDVEFLLWRVSDPPKLRVAFTLDNTRYTADVIPVLQPAHAVPAR